MTADTRLLSAAESLCPICLKALPAEIRRTGEDVFLRRRCPEHGDFSELIWRGPPDFETWRRQKKYPADFSRQAAREKGCPHDCGICPGHGQQACAVLFEITGRCNLSCPVCFADAKDDGEAYAPLDLLLDQIRWIRSQAGPVVLQVSGGEPTLHPELPTLVKAAAGLFPAVQLNTNGLRLAEDPSLAERLAEAGLSWVFLQFDGVGDRVFEILRGRPLLEKKTAAVANCAKAGLPVVLVPTVAAGVNDGELGDLLRLAMSLAPTVRGLHLQPMTASGRNSLGAARRRLTLPETLTLLAGQSGGLIDPAQASPPGCEHDRCSFHLRYRLKGGRLLPLKAAQTCCGPEELPEGPGRAIDMVVQSWGKPNIPMAGTKAPPDAFDEFLAKARGEIFSVTAMAFQDAWTADLARLRGCCIHVYAAPGRLIPFCAYNLTSSEGRPLHRKARGGAPNP